MSYSSFAQTRETLICNGFVILSPNTKCKNTSIEFTLVLAELPLVSRNSCIAILSFEKMRLKEDYETQLAYIYEKKENGKTILQDLVLNKVDGSFGMGQSAPNGEGMDVLSINGKCKKVKKLVN
jgi:hypothetical protein